MTVKIVTDSVAALPPQIAQELGITVVPLNVRFGTEVYRDGIDLTPEQFYERLAQSKTLPVTSVPTPTAFAEAYDKLAEEADEILVITLSSNNPKAGFWFSPKAAGLSRRCGEVDSGVLVAGNWESPRTGQPGWL